MSSSTNFVRVVDLESASNKSKTKYTELSNRVGELSGLSTSDKSSIVAAINEVAENVGGSTPQVILHIVEDDLLGPVFGTWVQPMPDIINNPSEYEGKLFLKGANFQSNFEEVLNSSSYTQEFKDEVAAVWAKIQDTPLYEAPGNSIVTYSNGAWHYYVPETTNIIIYKQALYKYTGEMLGWQRYTKDYLVDKKNVLYVFDAGYGDTLPATCRRGQKFLKQESGYCMVYTAAADNTWDSGFRLYRKVHSSNFDYSNYLNFYGSKCFKFASAYMSSINEEDNPYHQGAVVGEIGTGDEYTYNGRKSVLEKNGGLKIRHVTDIIAQVYDTVPSKTYAPAENNILMINDSYRRIYTNTNNTTRWNNKTYVEMPTGKAYLSLADKRIFSIDNASQILRFDKLLDGEMFYYEGDKSYYIYKLATDSFEKVGTSATTLTATLV